MALTPPATRDGVTDRVELEAEGAMSAPGRSQARIATERVARRVVQ